MKTIEEALALTSETGDIDFKSHFDPKSNSDILEVIKDIAAMANSGGGYIIFGIDDNGLPLALEKPALKDVDHAEIVDKMYKFTDMHFCNFEIIECTKNSMKLSALKILPCNYPIIFSKQGNYQTEGGKQKNAFSIGSMYFRHGAKSEPATCEDIRNFVDRKIESFRKQWMDGIAKVVEAPEGHRIEVIPPEIRHSPTAPTAIRLTSDVNAPAYIAIPVDKTHPYRQKDLISALSKRINNRTTINSYHILCARKEFNLDDDNRYVFKLAHASPQYSEECVTFLLDKYNKNNSFFEELVSQRKKTAKLHPSIKIR